MPRIVLKATPERDLYCEWSTIVDSVTFIGTRAEIVEYLGEGEFRGSGDRPEVRVSRADHFGTSAMYGDPHDGAWEDSGFVYEQRGWLPRARLVDLLDRYLADPEDPKVDDLLDPLEDD